MRHIYDALHIPRVHRTVNRVAGLDVRDVGNTRVDAMFCISTVCPGVTLDVFA
jgi:hypothetical protein